MRVNGGAQIIHHAFNLTEDAILTASLQYRERSDRMLDFSTCA
jgi:hypothetical protein